MLSSNATAVPPKCNENVVSIPSGRLYLTSAHRNRGKYLGLLLAADTTHPPSFVRSILKTFGSKPGDQCFLNGVISFANCKGNLASVAVLATNVSKNSPLLERLAAPFYPQIAIGKPMQWRPISTGMSKNA